MRLSWISLDGAVVKRILATSVESVLSWTVVVFLLFFFSLCIGATPIVCIVCETRAKIVCGVTCSGSYSSFRAISF